MLAIPCWHIVDLLVHISLAILHVCQFLNAEKEEMSFGHMHYFRVYKIFTVNMAIFAYILLIFVFCFCNMRYAVKRYVLGSRRLSPYLWTIYIRTKTKRFYCINSYLFYTKHKNFDRTLIFPALEHEYYESKWNVVNKIF